MKQSLLKFQLVFEAVLLFFTLVIVGILLDRCDYRWDLTQEKVYSLPKATANILRELRPRPLNVLAFYLQEDDSRRALEIFLKECRRHHPDFRYHFYDPSRRPALAKKFQISEPSTLLIQSGDLEQRIIRPTEESFTNAILRILHPQSIDICFVKGHGEVELYGTEPTNYEMFKLALEGYNARTHEIVLSRDHVPDVCQVVALAGPRWELTQEEFSDLEGAFDRGKGILFLLDPMDPGTGKSFREFATKFGVTIGDNVVVDKASRIVGGDFLMPLVSQYFSRHSVSKGMKQATFFPLLRSIQPSSDPVPGLEVTPLAMTGAGSWAETDLVALEEGNATFDIKTDIAGPVPAAVAVERMPDGGPRGTDDAKPDTIHPPSSDAQKQGRMIIVGDSDFLNNSYLNLSGNKEFGIRLFQWLAKDDRFVEVQKPQFKFKPLLLDVPKRTMLVFSVLVIYPLVFFVVGGLYHVIRSRTS